MTNDKRAALHSTASQHMGEARNNKDLTFEAKQRLIARAWVELQNGLKSLGDAEKAAAAVRRSTLERKLYGLPDHADASAMISYRDALDRASQVTREAEAVTLLSRAHTSGDVHLERAILATAYDNQWADVINTFTAANPATINDAEELWHATNAPQQTGLLEALNNYTPKPQELSHVDDLQIRTMAANPTAEDNAFANY